MKSTYAVAVAVLCLLSSEANAVGGGNTQGTLFAGQGLDWQRTATETQLFWHLEKVSFPPPPGKYEVNSASVHVTKCTPLSGPVARCETEVKLRPGHPATSQFCGQWLSDTKAVTVSLYAFFGWVSPLGDFVFQTASNAPAPKVPPPYAPPKNPAITFACGLSTPGKIVEWEWAALGALGKCMDWPNDSGPPYGYPPSSGSTDLFESCIRMVRGDYCGDGVSHTKDATLIDPYRTSFLLQHTVQPAFLLEANWSPVGALCIVHTRYVALPAACQDKFPVALDVLAKPQRTDAGVTGMRGSDYWCRKGVVGPLEQNCVTGGGPPQPCPWFKQVRTALQQGLLLNDSLLQP